jgi:hypothetical protein
VFYVENSKEIASFTVLNPNLCYSIISFIIHPSIENLGLLVVSLFAVIGSFYVDNIGLIIIQVSVNFAFHLLNADFTKIL